MKTAIIILFFIGMAIMVISGCRKYKMSNLNLKYDPKLSHYPPTSVEYAILDRMNDLRREIRTHELKGDAFSDELAERRIDDIITDEISHHGFDNATIKLSNLGADQIGENLAYALHSADSVVYAWNKSPGHRKNMINSQYDWVGIAHRNHNNRNYYCVLFVGDNEVN